MQEQLQGGRREEKGKSRERICRVVLCRLMNDGYVYHRAYFYMVSVKEYKKLSSEN